MTSTATFASKPKGWANSRTANNWVLDGDIFSKDSPKAYAPLGYGTLSEPSVVRPEDFKNDMQLPVYDERLPLRVSKPLGATFVDTESEKPDETRLSRKPVPREESKDRVQDPTARVVSQMRANKHTLLLGKTVLTEESLITNRVYLDKILKRKGGEDEDEESSGRADRSEQDAGSSTKKKARIERRSSAEKKPDVSGARDSNGGDAGKGKRVQVKKEDEEFYENENTVAPENVLRMVDKSLVETPEKERA